MCVCFCVCARGACACVCCIVCVCVCACLCVYVYVCTRPRDGSSLCFAQCVQALHVCGGDETVCALWRWRCLARARGVLSLCHKYILYLYLYSLAGVFVQAAANFLLR